MQFGFSRNEQLIYRKKLSKGEWEKVLNAFPGQLPLARLPAVANPTYGINIRPRIEKQSVLYAKRRWCMVICKRQLKVPTAQ